MTRRVLGMLALVAIVAVGCTDPTVAPTSSVTGANIFNDPNSYRDFLAKIYGGLIVTGQSGPAGDPDIGGIDEGFGEYLRLYWYLQEMPTDEAVIGWNDAGLQPLVKGTWDAGNQMSNAMYYRIYYQVMLANEFLRQSTDAKLASRGQTEPKFVATIHTYRAEVRFLRALSYWNGIDLFGNIPLVTEANAVGATPPGQATRVQLYNFVVAELNAIADSLPADGNYARATPSAARMLLAKLYLNADVYTGTPHYDLALAEADSVISSGHYTLDANFRHNFSADNNTSPEIIFVAAQDGIHTQTWGGMTFLIHAGCGGAMTAGNYGVDYCWGGYRLKQQAFRLYQPGDGRASFFFTTDSALAHNDSAATDSVISIADYNSGIPAPKFINKTSGGGAGQNPTMVDTDFPIFRLADAYLIYAEAQLRCACGSAAQGLTYFNALRQRAFGGSSANAASITTDSVLDERGRELLFEASRRTDLIRFGKFVSGYNWAWKNNTPGGADLPAGRDLYPLPANELVANPNLHQNIGY